jgi:hypothetical protein
MLDDDIQNMEYLMTMPSENFRLFCCMANSLEDGCLPRIGAANDKDAETCGEPSNVLCSFPLSFYILCSFEFGIGKRHLLPGCLRWWKWRRRKISAPWAVYCLVVLAFSKKRPNKSKRSSSLHALSKDLSSWQAQGCEGSLRKSSRLF